ncbi:MAG: hypothetical protein RSA66_06210, partial [Muribaculaceae bacterium]
ASSATRSNTLSSVISYAQVHKHDICNGLAFLSVGYAILAIDANNIIGASIAIIISCIAMIRDRKEAKND